MEAIQKLKNIADGHIDDINLVIRAMLEDNEGKKVLVKYDTSFYSKLNSTQISKIETEIAKLIRDYNDGTSYLRRYMPDADAFVTSYRKLTDVISDLVDFKILLHQYGIVAKGLAIGVLAFAGLSFYKNTPPEV